MQSIVEQVYARNLLAAQSEALIAVADDDGTDAEVDVMDSRLRLADARIARQPAETVADVLAKFDVLMERLGLDLDDGVDEKLEDSIRADLARLADCRLCRGVIGRWPAYDAARQWRKKADHGLVTFIWAGSNSRPSSSPSSWRSW